MNNNHKAWVITIDMGYGHQRAAYPLKDIAYERIITANDDKIVTDKERKAWKKFQTFYEGLSRIRSVPLIGEYLWRSYDRFQSISPLYPFRDLSKPNFGSIYFHRMINKGFLLSIVDYTRKKKLPFISTFFAPAHAAAHAGLKDVYCVVTDTDINRAWVPEDPHKDRIIYLTPTEHSTRRLLAYGVPKNNIFFTGFPLPVENLGKDLSILKRDLKDRLPNLDPKNSYTSRYGPVIQRSLGRSFKKKSSHPLTLTFAVGGAGAQKEIARSILKSLKNKIKHHEIRVNLIAGTRPELEQYFKACVVEFSLSKELGTYVNVFCTLEKKEHFRQFNEVLRTTDILWTKPSELAFYTALGLPIIIAPPIGNHEIRNQDWLTKMGSGFVQENPEYADEWLFEWLDKGILAEAAWEGFTEAPRFGTENITNIIFSKNKKDVKLRY